MSCASVDLVHVQSKFQSVLVKSELYDHIHMAKLRHAGNLTSCMCVCVCIPCVEFEGCNMIRIACCYLHLCVCLQKTASSSSCTCMYVLWFNCGIPINKRVMARVIDSIEGHCTKWYSNC